MTLRTRWLLVALALTIVVAVYECSSGGNGVGTSTSLTGPSSPPTIALSTTAVALTMSASDSASAPETVSVTNGGGGTLSGLAIGVIGYGSGPLNWLTATVSPTTAPATVTLRATMPHAVFALPATLSATVPVTASGAGVTNSPQTITATLTVLAKATPPTIGLSPASVTFNATAGGSSPAAQPVSVTNLGGGTLSGLAIGTISYGWGLPTATRLSRAGLSPARRAMAPPTGWLAVSMSGTTAPATLTLTSMLNSLPAGNYTASVPVLSSAPGVTNSPQTIAVTFAVAPGAATQIAFYGQFSGATAGQAMPAFQVAVEDASGNIVTSATTSITVAIGTNPASGTLSGTTTVAAVNGVANFANLSINNPGTGYTLTASATGLTSGTSPAFNITAPLFVAVSAGFEHTCAVTNTGQAYCWGGNIDGQLGNNTTSSSSSPVPVAGGLNLVALSAGYSATCGVTATGTGYCWGDNSYYELSDTSTVASGSGRVFVGWSAVPTPVSSPLISAFTDAFSTASAGYRDACGVTPAGFLWCWGYNGQGYLGLSCGGNQDCFAQEVGTYCSGSGCEWNLPASSFANFTSVSTGGTSTPGGGLHTCGLTSAGAAYCWGFDRNGMLGDGKSGIALGDTLPVAVAGGLTFSEVSVGGDHTCGLTSSGAVYCWGYNPNGELGNGSTTSSSVPVKVSSSFTFTAVSAGGLATSVYNGTDGSGQDHSCGVTSTGTVYCWGFNSYGELGNGTTTGSLTPVLVTGGLTFKTVSAGGWHTCGVTTTGVVYCWGANFDGQLGNSSTTSSSKPVSVTTP